MTRTDFPAGYVLIRSALQDVQPFPENRQDTVVDRQGGTIHTLRRRLLEIDGVRLAHALVGPDDLICYIEGFDFSRFNKTLNDIRHFTGHTETFLILAERGGGYSGQENKPGPQAAWLLCTVAVSSPEVVVDDLLGIKGVVNAHAVLGRFDIIAYIEAGTMGELQAIIDKEIRQAKGLLTTDTRIVLSIH